MRLVFFLVAFSILQGCVPNLGLSTLANAELNVTNLSRLKKGMTQAEVLKIMRHPYSDQVFVMDKDIYDVWFYVKEPTVLGQSRMVPLNLTPLTFKNGKLIGSGYGYFNYLKRRKEEAENPKPIRQPTAPPLTPKMERGPKEDIELEKLLQPLPVQQPKSVPLQQPKTQPAPKVAPSQQPRPKQSSPKGGGQPAVPTEQPLDLSPLEPQQPQSLSQPQGATGKKGANKGQPTEQPLDLSPLDPQSPQGPAQPQSGSPNAQGATGKKGQPPQPTEQPLNLSPLDPQSPQGPAQPESGSPNAQGATGKKGTNKGNPAQPTQQAPNWGPLEQEQPPPPTPPSQPSSQGEQTSGPVEVSMSSPSKEKPDAKKNPPAPEQKKNEPKVPLNEEDEEMLRDERMQDFDQT